jgi:hypothetical protein
MNADGNDPPTDEYNDLRHDEVEALAKAQISNSQLVEFAKNHPPPDKWFEDEEEDLF